MEHLPLPENFKSLLEYIQPYRLRKTYRNYRIITTQDYVLRERQRQVRKGKSSRISYREFEKEYLKERYGLNFRPNYRMYFRATRGDKF